MAVKHVGVSVKDASAMPSEVDEYLVPGTNYRGNGAVRIAYENSMKLLGRTRAGHELVVHVGNHAAQGMIGLALALRNLGPGIKVSFKVTDQPESKMWYEVKDFPPTPISANAPYIE
jgi:hypothetical protein